METASESSSMLSSLKVISTPTRTRALEQAARPHRNSEIKTLHLHAVIAKTRLEVETLLLIRLIVRTKLQALVYDILPLEEGPGKRCSECEAAPRIFVFFVFVYVLFCLLLFVLLLLLLFVVLVFVFGLSQLLIRRLTSS